MKLTPWFPGHIKPVRVGVYQRKYPEGVHYCHWDGVRWGSPFDNLYKAQRHSFSKSYIQDLPWRGIAGCKKCGGEMKPGKALEQTWTAGVPDFPGSLDTRIQTMSPGGPGKLVDCFKCVQCGWSVR